MASQPVDGLVFLADGASARVPLCDNVAMESSRGERRHEARLALQQQPGSDDAFNFLWHVLLGL